MAATWGNRAEYGEFRIIGAAEGRPKLLGKGSFGKTYEAVRTEEVGGNVVEEIVALKILDPELLSSASKRFQFVQERTALSRLKHANLIHSIKCGEDKGEVYFAMELCMGGDLSSLVRRFGALPERTAALIGIQAAAGLREMHRREMVHRDIKPANIMIFEPLSQGCTLGEISLQLEENESLCRIVDFGLVGTIVSSQGATGHGARHKFVGSMMYASPEQILERKDIDGRSDIYALGMTLWYLVQGRGPLLDALGNDLKHATEAEGRHLSVNEHEPDLPDHLSLEFRSILARMVSKRPEDRMPNAKELIVTLQQYLESSAIVKAAGFTRGQVQEGIQSFFNFTVDSRKGMGRQRFLAEDRSNRRQARLTIVEDLEDSRKVRPDIEDVVTKVCEFAQHLQQPDVPRALLPVREVVWAADALVYVEDVPGVVTLAEVLQARTTARRPISFREAEVIFRPIAEALDYLIHHGWEFIALPCEEVWLSDSTLAGTPQDKKLLCRPIDEWSGLRVVFSGMWVPPERAGRPSAEMSFASTSKSGSSFITAESLRPPVSAFLRLVYRTLSGSDVPDAADRWQNGYIASVSLQTSSNNLIRDLLCRQRDWSSVRLILNELCANEGVSVDSSLVPWSRRSGSSKVSTTKSATRSAGETSHSTASSASSKHSSGATSLSASSRSPAGEGGGDLERPTLREAREAPSCEIISVGVVRMGDHILELSPLEWASREFIKCSETGQWWEFPQSGRGMFEGRVEQLKFVFSPYTNESQEVEWADWRSCGTINCARTGYPFVLPQNIPLPVGVLTEGGGRVISFFAPDSDPIPVAPTEWVPGGQIICPTTGQRFALPDRLPPLEAMVDLHRPGWISSPYEPEAPWTLPSTEWFAGREIVCNSTRKALTLPREVEQWEAEATVINAATREVQSPYHREVRFIVPVMNWKRCGSVNCPPAGRRARLPMDIPLLMGQIVPGTAGVIRSPFSGETISVRLSSWITGREISCDKTGRPFLLPPGLPVPDGIVQEDHPGIAFSPYDPTRSVTVEPQHWIAGKILTCPGTGESFKLPAKLPPLHAFVTHGVPGLVRSPFVYQVGNASDVDFEFNVQIEDWVAGNTFECPVTKRIFILPPDIEEWIIDGAWVPGAPGKVRSPFRNGGEIELTEDQWQPCALITCPEAGRRFRVPFTKGFLSLAFERAAVQRANTEPEHDENAAADALKKDHPGATAAAILEVWTRHHLETAEKRLPKEFGSVIKGEPGFVTSPYTKTRMAVTPETWAEKGASILCDSGKRFLLPPDLPPLIGKVDSQKPGVVASPFAPDKFFQVNPWQWTPGAEIRCEHTGHLFVLPAKLPTWVPEAELEAGSPGFVINPFSEKRESIPVSGQSWTPENILSIGSKQYKLPKHLPPIVAHIAKGARGKVESPYAPGTLIALAPDSWTAGRVVLCTKTQREFLLPADLADEPFEGIDPREEGSIQSPYGKGGRFTVPPSDWMGGAVVVCPETAKRIALPKALPLLFGGVDPERPCQVSSPFDPQSWTQVASDDWIEGREVVCKKTGRVFRLPNEPLPLPFAEISSGKPGTVRSPFRNRAEIVVPPLYWIEGGEVEDRAARRRFRLPKTNLPQLEGVPVVGRSLLVRSPFDSKSEVSVPLEDWVPGHEVTCTVTHRKFVLPQRLDEPALPAALVDGRPGWIVDPYTQKEIAVPGPDWNNNGTITSPEGRKIVLPAKLPPLLAQLVADAPLQIRSPYDPSVIETLSARKWVPSTIVKCGGRLVQLPPHLPEPPAAATQEKSAFPMTAVIGVVVAVFLLGSIAFYWIGGDEKTVLAPSPDPSNSVSQPAPSQDIPVPMPPPGLPPPTLLPVLTQIEGKAHRSIIMAKATYAERMSLTTEKSSASDTAAKALADCLEACRINRTFALEFSNELVQIAQRLNKQLQEGTILLTDELEHLLEGAAELPAQPGAGRINRILGELRADRAATFDKPAEALSLLLRTAVTLDSSIAAELAPQAQKYIDQLTRSSDIELLAAAEVLRDAGKKWKLADAFLNLGLREQDIARRTHDLLEADKHGSMKARAIMGKTYIDNGERSDNSSLVQQGIAKLNEAVAAGDADGMIYLGEKLLAGVKKDLPADINKALELALAAKTKNHPEAFYLEGKCLLSKAEVEDNKALYQKAAILLGEAYTNNLPNSAWHFFEVNWNKHLANPSPAFAALQKGYREKDANCTYWLALWYEEGMEGTPKDRDRAHSLMVLASELGHSKAAQWISVHSHQSSPEKK